MGAYRGLLLRGVVLAACLAAPAWAGERADITGRYWSNPGYGTPPPEGDPSPARPDTDGRPSLEQMQLKGQYAKTFAEWRAADRAGAPTGDISALCRPAFLLGPMVNNVYPMEIIETPGQVIFLFEAVDRVRRIYTDGRKFPANLKPSYFGYSIGRWEGDTLVVETTGFTDKTTVNGAPHSDKVRTVERISRRPGTRDLQTDITIEDPEALSAPYHMRYIYRFEPQVRIMEYSCEENNRDEPDEGGEGAP